MTSDLEKKLAGLKYLLPVENIKKLTQQVRPSRIPTKRRVVLHDIQIFLEYNFTLKEYEHKSNNPGCK